MKIRKLMIRASIWVCALIFGIVFPNMHTNAKNLPSLLTNGRSSEVVSLLNNKKSLTLHVSELVENGTSDVITSYWNVTNHTTPLDPVLRACVSTTNVNMGNLLTATVTGNNTASGYTTRFVLLDATNIIVVGPQTDGTFLTPSTPGVYKIVAVNYSGTVSGLNVGQNISGITGTCWELSAPKCFNVQNPTCVSQTSVVLGNALTATITGNNAALITRYVLTDGNNIILQGPSVNSTFTPTSTGNYSIYAINYDGTVSGLTVGNNFLTQVGTSTECFSKSSPKCFSVTCWTITSTVTNPSSCGGTNGSIKLCGLPLNSSGYTVSYLRNGVAASLTNQTTDASGCITITNLGSGSYTDIKVSNSGCIGSNALTATLVEPSAPIAPTALTASTSTVCSGSPVSLSASGLSGASYTWTVSPSSGVVLFSNGGVVSGTSVSNVLSTSAQGTYTVSLTQTVGGCTSPAASTVVTVNGTPSAPVVVGTSSISNTCPSITADLTTKQPSAVSGQTYEWHTVATNPTASTLVATPTAVGAAGTYYLYSKSTTGGCYSLASSPVVVSINSCGCTNSVTVVLGNPLTASVTGNSTSSSYITQYVLTDANDVIVMSPSNVGSFMPTSTGSYKIYAINYTGSVNGLTVGSNFITGVTGTCIAKSSPKCFNVICWTITSTVTNPSSCGGTNGSIKLCGLPSNSAGYTVSYLRNGVVTSLTNQTTDASGCITITNLGSGSYTDIRVSNSGCVGSNTLTAILVEPTVPTAPTALTASASIVCSGSPVSLSASGLSGASYTWTVSPSGGAVLSSIGGVVSGTSVTNGLSTSTQGTYTVSLTQTVAGCTSPAASVVVTVNGTPSAPTNLAASISSTCAGSNVTLTASGLVGASYLWSVSPATGASFASAVGTVNGTSVTNTLNTVTQGTYTVMLSQSVSGCISAVSTVAVVINGINSAPTIVGTNVLSNICPSNTADLTVKQPGTVPNGQVFEWHTVSSNPNTNTLVANPVSVGTAGIYYLYTKSTTGGCYSPASSPVTVSILNCCPTIASTNVTSVSPSSCGGNNGSIKICGLAINTSGYTVNYVKDGITVAPLTNLTTDANGCLIISNLTAGSYTNIIISTASCSGTTPVSTVITEVSPTAPTGVAASAPGICSGCSTTLTAVCATGTVTWYSNAALTGVPLASNIVSVSATTTYFASCNLGSCKSASVSVTVQGGQCADRDGDGVPNSQDLDDDNDGILDTVELSTAPSNGDTDGDGIIDSFDLDSDNDGINDVVEANGTDNGGDGRADDNDGNPTNNNGIPSTAGNGLVPVDSDNDGQRDYQDLDTDNDTIGDIVESGSSAPDSDKDGLVDGTDSDCDGIKDAVDGNPSVFGDLNDSVPNNTDGTDLPDYRDVDSNNDGINDIFVNGFAALDINGDGRVDAPSDPDKDGIPNNNNLDRYPNAFGGLPLALTTARLQIKVLLQGALLGTSGTIMRDDLRVAGVIPTNEPYSSIGSSRFVHNGGGSETIGAGVLTQTGNDAIVDWVFVELRSLADPTVVVKTQSALLQRDGDVVSSTDGTSPLSFAGLAGNSYYIAIKHRNHLGVMANSPVILSASGGIVDFTTMSASQLYNASAIFEGVEMVSLNGKMALWAGDANVDAKIKYTGSGNDLGQIINQALSFAGNTAQTYNYDLATPLYVTGDANMDAKVKYTGSGNDSNVVLNNILLLSSIYNFDLFTEQIPR